MFCCTLYDTLLNNSFLMNSFNNNFFYDVDVDCKTVGFFLKISKEIGKAWRKSLARAKRVSLTRS